MERAPCVELRLLRFTVRVTVGSDRKARCIQSRNELNTLPDYVDLSAQVAANGGPSDFHIQFASDDDAAVPEPAVPEPASLTIVRPGIPGLGLLRRRKRT